MHIATRTSVHAPAQTIYALASATERWPILLPHYRFVRVLECDGEARLVEMAARRGIIPVRWIAEQRNDPRTPAIYFRHITGWTKDMRVTWSFEQRGSQTVVSITHDLEFAFPFARAFLERYVVAQYFIDGVARRTLSCMKQLVEERQDG